MIKACEVMLISQTFGQDEIRNIVGDHSYANPAHCMGGNHYLLPLGVKGYLSS